MKHLIKTFMAAVAVVLLPLTSCSQTNKTKKNMESDNKALVCYFSATGTTADAAKRIARITDADIHEIVPEARYTAADLDWTDNLSRSYVEMHNRTFRPAISEPVVNTDGYSVIFIGYPNWWNTHPTIINTFIEANKLKGKTVVPFMTSGGSNITNSEKELKEQYPSQTFGKGMLMNGRSDREIKEWIEALGL